MPPASVYMNPSECHQITPVELSKQRAFIFCLASVTGGRLFRDYQGVHSECIMALVIVSNSFGGGSLATASARSFTVLTRTPHRMPHVSTLRIVLRWATSKKPLMISCG